MLMSIRPRRVRVRSIRKFFIVAVRRFRRHHTTMRDAQGVVILTFYRAYARDGQRANGDYFIKYTYQGLTDH